MHGGSWLDRIFRRATDAPRSRAIAVLGMHRSGTSAITRGLTTLGVYLGNDFLDAQPENPTGYWEDKGIVELNERVLKALGLTWDAAGPVDTVALQSGPLRKLRQTAEAYVRRNFVRQPLWGFKDPRTMRVLPFWLDVFRFCRVDDAYLLVIRNPMSVAKSLYARQSMPLETALQLWLAYSIPFFDRTAGKATVVVDYDRFMLEPRRQLERVAAGLNIARSQNEPAQQLDRFASEFLDEKLRHTRYSIQEIDAATPAGRLARDAYTVLFDLACDRRALDVAFWSEWESLAARYTSNVVSSGELTTNG